MALDFEKHILPETAGLRLCKIVGKDDLKLCEKVLFKEGRSAVLTVLNRARICGSIGGNMDRSTDYWADQLDAEGDLIGEIRLDRDSWNSLKNHWMRCSIQNPARP